MKILVISESSDFGRLVERAMARAGLPHRISVLDWRAGSIHEAVARKLAIVDFSGQPESASTRFLAKMARVRNCGIIACVPEDQSAFTKHTVIQSWPTPLSPGTAVLTRAASLNDSGTFLKLFTAAVSLPVYAGLERCSTRYGPDACLACLLLHISVLGATCRLGVAEIAALSGYSERVLQRRLREIGLPRAMWFCRAGRVTVATYLVRTAKISVNQVMHGLGIPKREYFRADCKALGGQLEDMDEPPWQSLQDIRVYLDRAAPCARKSAHQ